MNASKMEEKKAKGGYELRQSLAYEDPSILATQTKFTVKEIKALDELFRKLCSSVVDEGLISSKEFQLGLFRNGNEQPLFADRIFNLLDFGEFIRFLSTFHPDTPQVDKAIFAFNLYDVWQTGFTKRGEVKEMITELLKESSLIISDDFVEAILIRFEEADSGRDRKIDIEKSFLVEEHDNSTLECYLQPV
ncbi:calcineurin B-like protein 4 [Olea europaea var. sylvestris]|uniref:calcineurin B-like protein 4 n=1 Tax=Olea europaea var. sylvestris TaxID=158386 RepID=UPI000C1D39CA|nr:calcineurin B-like protein 4 [Olea europaea var. sylvestris]